MNWSLQQLFCVIASMAHHWNENYAERTGYRFYVETPQPKVQP